MMQRVGKIRERDYMLVDTLDEHYAHFYRDMEQPYDDWRKNSYEETLALRELRRSARNHTILGAVAIIGGILGAAQGDSRLGQAAGTASVVGGAMVLKSGLDKYSESKINAEALRELGNSFEAEVAPKVVEVEGKTLTLTGSAEAQYEEWRRLLRDIYETETGFAVQQGSGSETDRYQPEGD